MHCISDYHPVNFVPINKTRSCSIGPLPFGLQFMNVLCVETFGHLYGYCLSGRYRLYMNFKVNIHNLISTKLHSIQVEYTQYTSREHYLHWHIHHAQSSQHEHAHACSLFRCLGQVGPYVYHAWSWVNFIRSQSQSSG